MTDDTSNKDKHQHFKAHAQAVTNAAKAISTTTAKLQKATKIDDRDQLHRELDTHVVDLQKSVAAATADPPPPPVENTGGAADPKAVKALAPEEEGE